jgi:hypothetical protein
VRLDDVHIGDRLLWSPTGSLGYAPLVVVVGLSLSGSVRVQRERDGTTEYRYVEPESLHRISEFDADG